MSDQHAEQEREFVKWFEDQRWSLIGDMNEREARIVAKFAEAFWEYHATRHIEGRVGWVGAPYPPNNQEEGGNMNVAKLELCKELYELSGWIGTHGTYTPQGDIALVGVVERLYGELGYFPAYDLGYLLRKLPPAFTWKTEPRKKESSGRFVSANIYMELIANGDVKFIIASVGLTTVWWQSYGTPEDAACKLAIELFKQEVLKKEEA